MTLTRQRYSFHFLQQNLVLNRFQLERRLLRTPFCMTFRRIGNGIETHGPDFRSGHSTPVRPCKGRFFCRSPIPLFFKLSDHSVGQRPCTTYSCGVPPSPHGGQAKKKERQHKRHGGATKGTHSHARSVVSYGTGRARVMSAGAGMPLPR